MGFVDGHVLRDRETAEARARRRRPRADAGRSLVDTLAAIHAVDVDAVGPRRPRPPRGLHRPPAQALVRPVAAAEDPRAAGGRRASTTCSPRRIPEQGPATIVHGDYRLDNCMVGDDGDGRRRARLGDLHARRPARRRRPAAGLLDRSRRRAERVDRPGDDGARVPEPAPSWSRATPSVSGRDLVAARLLRRVRVLEARLHPRGRVRPLPRRRARRSATPPSSSRSPTQVDRRPPAARSRVRWSGSDDRRPRSYELRRAARAATTPVLVVMLQGWIDASGAARGGDGRARSTRATATGRSHVRRRRVHRLPRPAADDGAARRREHPARLARDRAQARAATAAATTCCCSSAPSPTWRGTASPRRSPTLAGDFGVRHDGRPRRLPVRRAAHATATAVGHVTVGGRCSTRCRLPAEHGRRAGRDGGRARARGPRARASRRSASGRRCRTTSRR